MKKNQRVQFIGDPVSCMYLRIMMMMINKKSRNFELFCEFESSSFIFVCNGKNRERVVVAELYQVRYVKEAPTHVWGNYFIFLIMIKNKINK